MCHMICPGHSSRFDHPKNIWWWGALSSLLCSFLHSSVTWFLIGPNILLSTLFSNTLSLCSSLSVKDKAPQSYNNRQNYISVRFHLYIYEQQTRRQKILQQMNQWLHIHTTHCLPHIIYLLYIISQVGCHDYFVCCVFSGKCLLLLCSSKNGESAVLLQNVTFKFSVTF